jgi:hypothetical protein
VTTAPPDDPLQGIPDLIPDIIKFAEPPHDPGAARTALLISLGRDLSTLMREEIEKRWDDDARQAAEIASGHSWSALLPAQHNPAYYLASKVFFDNAEARGNPRFLYAPYHRDRFFVPICNHICHPEPPFVSLLWLGPRDTYKSTCLGCVALWFALRRYHLNGVFDRIVIRHHKEELAAANVQRIRAKVWHHPWMRRYWAEVCPPENTKDFGTMSAFSFANKPRTGEVAEEMFTAVGSKSSDTGAHRGLDLGDDLVTEDHINSRRIREDAKMRYAAKRYTLDSGTGREVNTGTRYHISDLWGMLEDSNVEGRPLHQVIKIPAISDEGVLAHPYKLTKKFLEDRRQEEISNSGSDMLWWLQYQLNPRFTKQIATNLAWLRECRYEEIGPEAIPLMTIDPAWKGTENAGEGDSASIQVWMLERRGPVILRYLVDGVHSDDLTVLDGYNHIFRLAVKYGITFVAPEEIGGHGFRTTLMGESATRGVPLHVFNLNATKTKRKSFRIMPLLKEAELGRVFLCTNTCDVTLIEAFKTQFRDFHPQMDHDDAIDSASFQFDPEIASRFTPEWNSALEKARKRRMGILPRRRPDDKRTRYTAM